MLKYAIFGLLAAIVVAQSYIRLRPLNAEDFHIGLRSFDADTIGLSGDFQSYAVAAKSGDVATLLARIIEATPRTQLLAGSLTQEGLVSSATYVTRSGFWGFPDATTIEVETTNLGATLRIYGRLIYGRSDFGVNKARLDGWIDQLYAAPLKDYFGNPVKRLSS